MIGKNKLRVILVIFIVCILFFSCIVNAKSYVLTGTDISINFDDTEWYVFTRDNLLNNPELDELDLNYEYMYNSLYTKNTYLDAILFLSESDTDFIEAFVSVNEIEEIKDINNFTNYSRDKIMELAKGVAEKVKATAYDVYQNDYKFIELDCQDQGFFIKQYHTMVNGKNYTITFQKPYEFTTGDIIYLENIINTIEFDIDYSLKNNDDSSFWENIYTETLATIILMIIGIPFVNKFDNKKLDSNVYEDKKRDKSNEKNKWSFLKVIGIIVLSVITSEVILMIIFGDKFENVSDITALLIVAVFSIPIYYIYKYLFNLKKYKKTEEANKIVYGMCKVCGKTIPYNENRTCEECHQKIMERLADKKELKSNTLIDDIAPIKKINCKVCDKEIPYNENGTCEECHQKIIERLSDKKQNIPGVRHINLSDKNEKAEDKIGLFDIGKEEILINKNNKKRYCTNCGNEVEDKWKFCKHCGKEII